MKRSLPPSEHACNFMRLLSPSRETSTNQGNKSIHIPQHAVARIQSTLIPNYPLCVQRYHLPDDCELCNSSPRYQWLNRHKYNCRIASNRAEVLTFHLLKVAFDQNGTLPVLNLIYCDSISVCNVFSFTNSGPNRQEITDVRRIDMKNVM